MTDDSHLHKDEWPECIPESTDDPPPYEWGEPAHDPAGVDDYPNYHPDAASLGEFYLGDVCPWCGVPLSRRATVVLHDGTTGKFWDINDTQDPAPAYHPECFEERATECGDPTYETI